MTVFWLLLPVLAWGILPVVVSKLGGEPVNQIFGTALGTLIVGLVVEVVLRPTINRISFIWAMLAGVFWIVGQLGQYTSYANIGVSKTMPISTGLQLVGTALVGVVIFGEWPTLMDKVIGSLGILILILGSVMTSTHDHQDDGKANNQQRTITMLILTTLGFVIFNAIPKALSASGVAIFLPESIGMSLAVLLFLTLKRNFKQVVKEKSSWRNLMGGFIFSIASLAYILSVNDNGVNTAFVVSQLSVVISTIGGLLVLKEYKSHRELLFTVAGLILVITGAIVTTII
ncbi:GRP family sugar transporter [Pediococcus acidilactici]|uniref:GRP family sugar transporter n=1 Tax=Pediococcus acidilactici TaxID=1254 RepID=UPI000235B54F|nr:GRP family sugar transporter [Pediococcus acidilactici]EHJ21954.1 glucose uptake protein [Pediococcus acidilactici MA18/5M]MBM6602672.1 sugar transporter [Pediococcus acidilactici]MBM6642930.1 sugar transporter [Pediococcus acidilactici]MCB5722100.1 GRP family sugar transporter [Pediococcus acidilactici]MCB5728720.1 GRP family sugar transporter [Pediococcus acidilactici]